jgi:hypothetical protein
MAMMTAHAPKSAIAIGLYEEGNRLLVSLFNARNCVIIPLED